MIDSKTLSALADVIKARLPDQALFALLTVPPSTGKDGQRIRYISNAKREDMIGILASWVDAQLANPDLFAAHKDGQKDTLDEVAIFLNEMADMMEADRPKKSAPAQAARFRRWAAVLRKTPRG